MEIKVYNNRDSNNVINKTLTDELIKDITLKDRVNILNPTIRLKDDLVIDRNYCYISDFKRYYFIDEIVFLNKGIQEIYLTCDLLETYKDDILNSESNIVKSEKDNFISQGRINEETSETQIYKGREIDYKDNIVLVTIK